MTIQYRLICLIVVGFALLLSSCAPRQQGEVEISKYAKVAPTDLSVDVNHNYALLRWKTNRGDDPIMGYDIYIARGNPVASDGATIAAGVKPFNDDVYPGDTDPQIDYETFEAKDLEDGVEYFAAVTIIFPGDRMSRPSNVVKFICHPHGKITLGRSYSGDHDGYSFEDQEYVATDALGNQIYFTQIKDEDYLASPSRLDDILPSIRFFASNIRALDDPITAPSGSGADKIAIKAGTGCILRTASGQYCKIVVRGFTGTGDDRAVALEYSYMSVPGNTDF
jgi:hypothetical protein